MRISRWPVFAASVAPLGVAACAANPPPVPVRGPAQDVSALAGEWRGEYWSAESGRSGSIHFRLEAGPDTAQGDVLMVPAGQAHTHPEGRHPPSEFPTIRFVRVLGDRVRGVLDTYRDPACGCRLETTFDGRLRADTIAGVYESRHLEGGDLQTGQRRVVRYAEPGRHP